MKRIVSTLALTAAMAIAPAGAAVAAPAGKTAPETPATKFHGLPGNNAGFSDQSNGACPASNGNKKCDGGIHGIATNPGQSGVAPGDRNTPPACDMHAGLNAANRNC